METDQIKVPMELPCDNCGQFFLVDPDEVHKDDEGRIYCDKCHEDLACPDCGSIPRYPMHSSVTGKDYCEECYSEGHSIGTVIAVNLKGGDPIGTDTREIPGLDDPVEFDRYDLNDLEDSGIPFKPVWVQTDGWRGHYNVPRPEDWIYVGEDAALSGSGDASNLETFTDMLVKYAVEHDLVIATVITQTSNVFCAGVDTFIKSPEDPIEQMKLIMTIEVLKSQYRDRDTFMRTALTGSDEKTHASDVLVAYSKHLSSTPSDKWTDPQDYIKEYEAAHPVSA